MRRILELQVELESMNECFLRWEYEAKRLPFIGRGKSPEDRACLNLPLVPLTISSETCKIYKASPKSSACVSWRDHPSNTNERKLIIDN